ncbi:MAG TPA: DUF1328 domain-containing protein [Bdellovibrionales bacterium]|nr:DUF1328 domain-containing protein [Bdellovibrionales bacterium]
MLRAGLVFLALALIAYVLGATGVAGISMEIGRILLMVFLVLAVIGVAAGLIGGGRPKDVI